ncbi:MAG: magnesium transporter [Candidatus Bathyarchaeota archaeon]|nr:magnesium transporter [Candidatus Bathyarchaeota archaeon]
MFKETAVACLFDIGGLVAGFMIAVQLGIFQLSPWAIALYPAVVSVKSVITGLLTGRLSTALHLGTVYPRFRNNTKTFYKLIQAMIVLTLATSATISAIAIVFGSLFWGITLADFPAILAVMVSTMSLGLLITLLTVKFTFSSFKEGLDPDTIVYPAVSTIAGIIITFLYIAVLNLYFSGGYIGQGAIVVFGLVNVLLVLYILPKNVREEEVINTLKESLLTMVLVAFMANITGTILKGISNLAPHNREIYTVYPAMIDMMGDVSLVIGSAATTKLALGILTPSFASIKNHAKNIFSAWLASLLLFMILGLLSLSINGALGVQNIMVLLGLLLIANIIAFVAITLVTFAISILTFKRGLDPDHFVLPLGSSLADAITTAALFAALIVIMA